ncbi:acyl-CoA dehydrogenase family protein [Lysinibacillus sp. LZ02]|uniref:acyl-CoA dehydrogenase family protein n=1 Tax=Lysinibacillus sp. LZ02 TaxID=3420668 RepID=UPI003D36AEF2
MNFTFTKEEELFRQELRIWLEENLPEGWLDGKRDLPEDDQERKAFLRAWQRKLYEGNWAGVHWPKEYGGRGATHIQEVIYQEELARMKAPPVLNFMGINMVGPTLMQMGSPTQKERYIDKILSGEEIWCQGFSEPNAGSDLAGIQTRAVERDGKWYITGQKVWTTYAHMADKCLILARTHNASKRHEGLTAFLIDMHQPGVEVRPIYQMNDDHDFNELFLQDAVAEADDIIAGVGMGWKVSMALLSHERVGVASTIFHLENLFEDLIADMKIQTYRGKPLMDDPYFARDVTKYYIRLRAATLNYYRNLTKTIEQGYPGPEGSIDKLVTSELSKAVTGFATAMLGLVGCLWKEDRSTIADWAHQYLQSFGSTIAGGTSEVLKNVIGEHILALPKDLR